MPDTSQNDHAVIDLKKLPRNQRDQALVDIQRMEKHNFPTHEAMTFDSALVAKSKVSVLMVRGDDATVPILAYAVCIRQHRKLLFEKLCVHEKYRRNGYATAILSFVIDLALRTACTTIDLWVDETRLIAKMLYQQHGFTIRDRMENYYCPGRNAFKMSLDLC